MKNSAYRFLKLKYQLNERRRSKQEYVIWELDDSQKDYIETVLRYPLEAWIYEIKTQPIVNVNASCSLLKDIHYAYRRNKHRIYRKLKKQEIDILKRANISYRIKMYKIFLQQKRS